MCFSLDFSENSFWSSVHKKSLLDTKSTMFRQRNLLQTFLNLTKVPACLQALAGRWRNHWTWGQEKKNHCFKIVLDQTQVCCLDSQRVDQETHSYALAHLGDGYTLDLFNISYGMEVLQTGPQSKMLLNDLLKE